MVVLVVDGLRADRAREIASGDLDAWLSAESSLVFERAYAPSSLAEQSLSSLFTGRMPTHGGSVGLAEAQPASEALTLATRLRRAGYTSAFVSQSSWAGRPGFTRGFHDVQVAPQTGWANDEIVQRAVRAVGDWQAEASGRPLFLVAHWASPIVVAEEGIDVSAQYARRMDEIGASVVDLLEQLEQSGALNDALLVLTAGHGFELSEHGGVGTGWNLEEEVIRVPLVLTGSVLGTAGRTVRSPVSTAALAGTLLDLADPTGEASRENPVPSLPLVTQSEARPVLSELVIRERTIQRAVIQDDVKYLQVLREVPVQDRAVVERGYEELQAAMLNGTIPTPPLFGDPSRETLSLLPERGLGVTELPLNENVESLSRLRALLRDYQRLCESEGWMPPRITDRLPIDASDIEDLESLGYM